MHLASRMEPRVASPAVHQACANLFTSVVKSSGRFTYKTLNDFGKRLEVLLFATPSKGFTNDFFENIKEVGEREGFQVRQSDTQFKAYSVRDPKLQAADGTILEPSSSSGREKAIDRTLLRQKYLRLHPAVLTKNAIFTKGIIGGAAKGGMVWRAVDGLDQRKPRYARSYFEGGNVFHLTNREGVSKYLLGDDLITATQQILRLDKWFAPPGAPHSSPSWNNEELFYPRNEPLRQLFFQGQIPEKVGLMAAGIASSLSDQEVLQTLKEMHAMGLIPELMFETDADRQKGREIAANYLAQRKFVQEEVFANDLRTTSKQIVSVPQIAYHLDFLMTPGPNGSIFLQDYTLSVTVLKQIKEKAALLGLTQKDLELLDCYIVLNQVFGKQFEEVMKRAKDVLTGAGFTVIPTPGAFFCQKLPSEKNSDGHFANVNFFNALTGFSPKTNHFYMIVPGTNIGERLGEVLMDTYVEFLKQHCDNLAVYFVGRKPDNPRDFSEAMYCLNRPTSQLGPHCLSFELKTQECTPPVPSP